MKTTSYKSPGLDKLLTYLVKSVGAKKIIEFGTQQGHSAIRLAKGGGKVKTYDLFEETYPLPPYKKTHAHHIKAYKNTKDYDIQIYKKDAYTVKPVKCDVLHIDICNHYGNVLDLLMAWEDKVGKMIILEGGVHNKWQKKHGFEPFNGLFRLMFMENWNHIVIRGKGGYAMTVLTRI